MQLRKTVFLVLAAMVLFSSFTPAFADSASQCNSVVASVWVVISILTFLPFAAVFEMLGKFEVNAIVRVVLGMVAASLVLLVGIQFIVAAVAAVNCGNLTVVNNPPIIGIFAPEGPGTWTAVMNQHLLSNPDYGISFNVGNLNAYPSGMAKTISFSTYTNNSSPTYINTQTTAATANGFKTVAYDNEPCNNNLSTPATEYNGMFNATQSLNAHYSELSSTYVKNATKKFEITPGRIMLVGGTSASSCPGGSPSTTVTAMQQLHWGKVDSWTFQAEGSPDNTIAQIVQDVNTYAVPAIAQNPNLKVYVEINPAKQGFSSSDVNNLWAQLQPMKIAGLCIVVHIADTSPTFLDQILTAVGR